MKDNNTILFIIGTIIAGALIYQYSNLFIIQNNQWYSTELGWQSYSFFDNEFENYNMVSVMDYKIVVKYVRREKKRR